MSETYTASDTKYSYYTALLFFSAAVATLLTLFIFPWESAPKTEVTTVAPSRYIPVAERSNLAGAGAAFGEREAEGGDSTLYAAFTAQSRSRATSTDTIASISGEESARAAALARIYYDEDNSYTATRVARGACEGCFFVTLSRGQREGVVRIENWQVAGSTLGKPKTEKAGVMERARNTASVQYGLKSSEIAFHSMSDELWSNTCLDLSRSISTCRFTETKGYRIVFSIEGALVPYRSNLEGTYIKGE